MNRPITTAVCLGAPLLLAASYQLSGSTVAPEPAAWGETLGWGDFDNDGLQDVLVVAGGRAQLLHNDGDGAFSDVTRTQCLAPGGAVLQGRWGDSDRDGWLDLLLVTRQGRVELWRSDEGACFQAVTTEKGLSELEGVLTASWLDYDRDGVLDLQLSTAQGHALLHGSQGGPFIPSLGSAQPGVSPAASAAAANPTRGPRAAAGVNPGTTLSGPGTVAAGGAGTYATPCSQAVLDQNTGSCVGASSDPTLGHLYPLSSDFHLDAGGDVFFGDGTDRTTVIQNGLTASQAASDGGGNFYVQTGSDLTPGSTARLLFTGMEGTPVHASIDSDGDFGVGVQNPGARLHVSGDSSQDLIRGDVDSTMVFQVTDTGRVVTTAVEITGGGDLVEGFETSDDSGEPGTVMSIDPGHPGQLVASRAAYDTKVAGVVSGAGGVDHGIRMGQHDVLDGDTLLAMTGRVWVKCSAENGAISPGDRLTTASVQGHAMKVTDGARSVGAVIGKAMSSLDEGTGLVLVLVNLQ